MRCFTLGAFATLSILAGVLAITSGASAQTPQAPRQSTDCVYTGAPTDEVLCELARVRADRAQLQQRLDKVLAEASIKLGACDSREAGLAVWFKGYFGETAK